MKIKILLTGLLFAHAPRSSWIIKSMWKRINGTCVDNKNLEWALLETISEMKLNPGPWPSILQYFLISP
jgi:hypothetical protein